MNGDPQNPQDQDFTEQELAEMRTQAALQPVEEQGAKAGEERREFEAILRSLTFKLSAEREPSVRASIIKDLEREIGRTWAAAWQARSRHPEQVSEQVAWGIRNVHTGSVWAQSDKPVLRAGETEYEVIQLFANQPSLPAAGWEPIESAPKDGTRILILWGDEVVIGRWLQHNKELLRPHGCWYRSDKGVIPVGSTPTHWQPLPDLPIKPQGGK